MNIAQALAELGVREDTLTEEEKAQLDRDGYLPLRGVLSGEQVDALRARQAELLADEGENAGKEVHQEAGTDRLSDLINKGDIYSIVLTTPRVLAGIAHVLGNDLKLSSLNSRSALPGQGLQGLHADWNGPVKPDAYQVCNSIWLLDDFTPDNGATRVVAGSQRTGKMPSEEMKDPRDAHPNEATLLGKAGDRGDLQRAHLARRHAQPHRPAAPRPARLFLPPPPRAATGSAKVSASRNPRPLERSRPCRVGRGRRKELNHGTHERRQEK